MNIFILVLFATTSTQHGDVSVPIHTEYLSGSTVQVCHDRAAALLPAARAQAGPKYRLDHRCTPLPQKEPLT